MQSIWTARTVIVLSLHFPFTKMQHVGQYVNGLVYLSKQSMHIAKDN